MSNTKILIFFILLLCNTSYATDSCLVKDSNGKLIYNKDSKKKCILIRTIDSNTRNKLTNEGLEDIIGKGCGTDNFIYTFKFFVLI